MSSFSSSSSSSRTASTATTLSETERKKLLLLEHSLKHVYTLGWTENAIAAGMVDAHLTSSSSSSSSSSSLSSVGLLHKGPSDVLHFFMQRANQEWRDQLWHQDDGLSEKNAGSSSSSSIAEWVALAIRRRLQLNVGLIQAGQWQQGMALGASPTNLPETMRLLQDMADTVLEFVALQQQQHPPPLLTLATLPTTTRWLTQQGIIGIYAVTELHMLADASENFEDSWTFLKDRLDEAEMIWQTTTTTTRTSSAFLTGATSREPDWQNMLVASAVVVKSLGGALLSLAGPPVSGAASIAATMTPFASSSSPFPQAPLKKHREDYTKPSAFDKDETVDLK